MKQRFIKQCYQLFDESLGIRSGASSFVSSAFVTSWRDEENSRLKDKLYMYK